MTKEEYAECLLKLGSGKQVTHNGRTATTLEQLNFIRDVEASGHDGIATDSSKRDANRMLADMPGRNPGTDQLMDALAGVQGQVNDAETRLQQHQDHIEELNGDLAERDGKIASLNGQINQHQGRITQLEGDVRDRDFQIGKLKDDLAASPKSAPQETKELTTPIKAEDIAPKNVPGPRTPEEVAASEMGAENGGVSNTPADLTDPAAMKASKSAGK